MVKATTAEAPDHVSTRAETRTAPVLPQTAERPEAVTDRESFLVPAALAILTAVLYYRIATHLFLDWYRVPDQSHGLLIPFFIAYLLWRDRGVLERIPRRPSWFGIPMLALGLLVLLLGVLGADLFLARLSFLLVAVGLVWSFCGARFVGKLRFCLFVALLAIPLPAIVLNQITFPLQLQASQFATFLLTSVGVPVLREGNVLQLSVMKLEVAEACSGIRSLMSLLTVAVIYGYFAETNTTRRVILVLMSIPIAIAANAARIFGTGLCVQYWDPDKALGFFHEFSGWLMFLVSLACLYAVHRVMELFRAGKHVPA